MTKLERRDRESGDVASECSRDRDPSERKLELQSALLARLQWTIGNSRDLSMFPSVVRRRSSPVLLGELAYRRLGQRSPLSFPVSRGELCTAARLYRSAPVMEAREDLQWRRETPGS